MAHRKSNKQSWRVPSIPATACLGALILIGGCGPGATGDQQSGATGKVATGKIGERVEGGDEALTVERVEHKQQIGQNTKAEAGKEWLVVHVLIENTGKEKNPYNPLYFHVKDDKGVEVGSDSALEDDDLKGGDLGKGEKVKGATAFQVGADAKGLVLTYDFGGSKSFKITLDK